MMVVPPDRPPVRLVLAHPHNLERAALCQLLEAGGFHVVGETDRAADAVELVRTAAPDVLLVDLAIGQSPALDFFSEIAQLAQPVRTIILAAAMSREDTVRVLRAGALGVVLKDSSVQTLFDSIDSVMAGRHWIARETISDLISHLRADEAPPVQTSSRPFGLTAREMEIVANVVAGYNNREIARQLAISAETVKHHLSNIFDKVGASNRLELALFVVHHRVLDGDPRAVPVRAPRAEIKQVPVEAVSQ
jgi:two-component system, NarL family, nitrate/nitrite response regulator NarL